MSKKLKGLYDALRRIASDMERGRYIHVQPSISHRASEESFKRAFNMLQWVCCLGGWVEVELNRRMTDEEMQAGDRLFYPRDGNLDWRCITPRDAASAVLRFLDGKEPWPRDDR